MTHVRIVCLGCMSTDDSHHINCPVKALGPMTANPQLLQGAFTIGSFLAGTTITSLMQVELNECQDCFAVVRNISQHQQWHAREAERNRELQLRTDKRPPSRRT